MTRLYLVRHGRATGGWDVDVDPGLDTLGREQALTVAERLSPLGPLVIVSSPMRRCRETSAPLAGRWGASVTVEPAVTEIPSPDGYGMQERVDWLRSAMAGTWGELGGDYTSFRDAVVARLVACPQDAVVFSHFIAINAAIGDAIGDDRLVIRSLDNCSVTVMDVIAGRLTLVEGGHEADTLIR
ncbi:MAG: histidine phosphatase family protein [Ilumatobacteraceae bacterium]